MGSVDPSTHYLVYHATLSLPHNTNLRHAVYVESSATSTKPNGTLFYVRGIPSQGPMDFFWMLANNPLLSDSGRSIRRVGWVFHHNHFARLRALCENLPRPGQQGPDIPGNCEEWTLMAIQALRVAGILMPLRPEDPTDTIEHE